MIQRGRGGQDVLMGEMSFRGVQWKDFGTLRLIDQSKNQVRLTAAVWITSASWRCLVNIQDWMHLQPENSSGWRCTAYKETFGLLLRASEQQHCFLFPTNRYCYLTLRSHSDIQLHGGLTGKDENEDCNNTQAYFRGDKGTCSGLEFKSLL